MTKTRDDRRVKRFHVDQEFVLAVFSGMYPVNTHLMVPRMEGVPATACVRAVFECPARCGFMFVVEDESFDPLMPGDEIPEIPVTFVIVELAVKPVMLA